MYSVNPNSSREISNGIDGDIIYLVSLSNSSEKLSEIVLLPKSRCSCCELKGLRLSDLIGYATSSEIFLGDRNSSFSCTSKFDDIL